MLLVGTFTTLVYWQMRNWVMEPFNSLFRTTHFVNGRASFLFRKSNSKTCTLKIALCNLKKPEREAGGNGSQLPFHLQCKILFYCLSISMFNTVILNPSRSNVFLNRSFVILPCMFWNKIHNMPWRSNSTGLCCPNPAHSKVCSLTRF